MYGLSLSLSYQDPAIRAFLLTNLIPADSKNPHARFRIPIDIIHDAIPELGGFPTNQGSAVGMERRCSSGLEEQVRSDVPFLSFLQPPSILMIDQPLQPDTSTATTFR